MHSFIAICKLQYIDPSELLDDVERRIPTQPQEKLTELLPQFYKPLLQKIPELPAVSTVQPFRLK